MVNIGPSMTARTRLVAHAVVSNSIERYSNQSQHSNGSFLVKARVDYIRGCSISFKDVAALKAGGTLALTSNTCSVYSSFSSTCTDTSPFFKNVQTEKTIKHLTETSNVSLTIWYSSEVASLASRSACN